MLLKLSGEALMGEAAFGLDAEALGRCAEDIRCVRRMGVEVCIVVGGGNIFRGLAGAAAGIDRVTADGMGMLATRESTPLPCRAPSKAFPSTPEWSPPSPCARSASLSCAVGRRATWTRGGW